MQYDAVIFDLDGTITESAPGIMNSVSYALNSMNLPVPGEDVLRAFVGPPLVDSFMRFIHLSEADAHTAVKKYRERHTVIGWKEALVYKGMLRVLISLKRAGVYVALASSKPLPLCEKTLDYFGLLPLFDKLVGPEYSASSSDKELLIKQALPEKYNRACMVGDRKFDMDGAKRAGIEAIGAGYGYGSREELMDSGADYYAETPDALLKLLLPEDKHAPGFFISLEGSDGCGKSTQLRMLTDFLNSAGASLTVTREPGGCPISERIRSLVLDVKAMGMTDECEALLFAASRAQHVRDVIRPALKRGDIVVCDRFVDSSIAYQGAGRNLGPWVREINERAVDGCMPDLTLFLDLDPDEALRRRISANAADRIESADDGFMRRVYSGFKNLQNEAPKRVISIDASGEIEQIYTRIRQTVIDRLVQLSIRTGNSEG
ncbi:MAG: dTMP kinase [Clostridia bacterium]|nr:dTMP kinase [Clostridia bacterium]